MTNSLDLQMSNLYEDLLKNGIKKPITNQFYPDGTPAYRNSLIGGNIRITDSSLLFTTAKRVAPKSATNELLSFVRDCAFDIKTLNSLGVHVWDNQHYKDGTIGKAYGYQYANPYYVLKSTVSQKTLNAIGSDSLNVQIETNDKYVHLNQFEYVIYSIIDNPYSTRIMTDIWNIKDLPDMILEPCIFSSQWIVTGDKLNVIVKSRSSDSFLGLPFNLAQWSVIHHIIAKLTNYKVGIFEFQFGDVHIYDHHRTQAQEFVDNVKNGLTYPAPTLLFDKDVTWSNIKYGENMKLMDYKYASKIPAELSNNLEEMKQKDN